MQEEEEQIMKKRMEKNTKPFELPWHDNIRWVFKAMRNSLKIQAKSLNIFNFFVTFLSNDTDIQWLQL